MRICLIFDVWIVFLQTETFAFAEREQIANTENKKYNDLKHEKRSNKKTICGTAMRVVWLFYSYRATILFMELQI